VNRNNLFSQCDLTEVHLTPVNISVTISASIHVLRNKIYLWGTSVWSWGVRVQPVIFLSRYARHLKTQRPDLRLYRSHPKLVTILPDLTRKSVQIRSHQTSVYWCPSILLHSQPGHYDNREEREGKRGKDGTPGWGIVGCIVREKPWLHPTSTDCTGGETSPTEVDYSTITSHVARSPCCYYF
jgi:hypothetical protein